MAVIYLVAGIVIGFVLRVSQSPVSAARSASVAAVPPATPTAPADANPPSNGNPPGRDQLKLMADSHAAPLLAKLKSDPNNSSLLMQIGSLYHAAHQFTQAAAYFAKAVQADPKNGPARTKLAISLYREGDVDGAITQLNRVLHDAPGDADALFNLGMIRLQGKQDGAGAVAAWKLLLKLNPQLSEDRKAEVERLMAGVQTSLGEQNRNQGASNNGQP